MLGGTHTDLLVTVVLLFLTQTGTQCRAETDVSLVTLPERRATSEYVTQCYYDRQSNLICDWIWSQQRTASEDVAVNILESGPLGMESMACLEFWYLAPAAANGSELRVLLKSSVGLAEIWTSPALPKDAWRQVFVHLNITEPGTQVVFEAVQAASMEEQVIFKQIGVRRGSCRHQCESNTEFWTDESTRCLCSAGQLFCFPTQCPQGQICGLQRGGSNGIFTSGMCTIHSHADFSTFDGVLFRFMAPCTYVLAKTCSSTEALPMFSVEVINEQNGNASQPTVQQIILDMGNIRVSLLRRQTNRVVVNGVWRKLPLSFNSGSINIRSNPVAIVLQTSFGLSVSYDNAGAVHITLPSTYSDKVCGLCGNFNHLRDDDFHKPDGTNAQNATTLAESWQTGETTSSCETILVPHQCDPQEEAEYASELYCGGLLSNTGPFADCLSVLRAESYFRGCVVGMCSSQGDPAVLCEAVELYAGICQEAGVAVPIWRNSTFCPLQCGENSHYNSCADGCPEVCASLDVAGSCGSCEERCECDSGFKLRGGKCVPAEDCGCWYKVKQYEKGETLLEGDCVKTCQCMGDNAMHCTSMQCADNEVCKIKDGVKGCFSFKPATCSVYGDPHYITFDRLAYDFQGGCSYTLTTTCTGESLVEFSVIGHNMHPPLQNFTRAKLEAVTLQTEDLYLTLNQSGQVYVHHSHVQLPFSTNGTYGSVWAYMKNNSIIMETTFGLRMEIDGQNRLFLQVDERYKYELCGLCGTYSGHQDDDFVTPGGNIASEPFEFGDSWRRPDNNECIAHPNDPQVCDNEETNRAYEECSALFGDAFQACHEHVHPSIYLNSCVYDYCATSGDQHTLCESLKSYASACQVAGVDLHHWQIDTVCADPSTTSSLPTTPSPTSPTPDQTFCPMNCNFDKDLCGWEQLIQDSFDWTRHSGPTPSDLTGPNQDHTTGAGFYMYLEGNNVTHGDPIRLFSSMCHYDGPLCLHFWYHMYGSATAMALNIYLLKGNIAAKLWSRMNNQGPEWQPGNVDISVSGPFQIILEGIRGSNDKSDVAIDDVSIHLGSCSGSFPDLVNGTELHSTTAQVLPSDPMCDLDCSFDSNLCSWNQMVTDAFDWTWQSGSTPTMMTGPSADHTGDGHYLYIEASSVSQGDTARLISSKCSDSGPQCLQFWYHLYGSADTMGLHVYLLQNSMADAVWWRRNDQGNTWHLAQVDINITGTFQIIIEGRRGSNDQSDVAIDDVKLYHGHCSDLSGVTTQPAKPDSNTTAPPSVPVPTNAAPEPSVVNITAQPPVMNVTVLPTVEATTSRINTGNVTEAPVIRPPLHPVCQLHCNFEQDLCQWNQMLTDVFDWTWQSGSTPTMITGPSSDHTTGDGHYLYIEANSVSLGDTSRLISSQCTDSGPQCLQFWYHMYGSADTMGLHVYLLQDRKADAIWRKSNNQGNMWHLAQVDFATTGAFQIIFEGQRGSNDQSDVAIDDVSLHRGHCADLAKPTTPALAILSPLATLSEVPSLNSSTTTQPPPTSSKPDPQLTTAFKTTTKTTAAPTDGDTQTPTKPRTTVILDTSRPDVPTTRPQPPITSRLTAPTGPQTTDRPQPPTTDQLESKTTAGPQPPSETQPKPQTKAGPQPPTQNQPKSQTIARPQPLTQTQPKPQTTVGPQPPTENQPKPQTTAGPQPPTETQPQPQTTAGPQPPTKTQPKPQTTAGPQPQTETQPQPQTTAGPQPPTQTRPKPQTTVGPQPPTQTQPKPQTTAGPQPPTQTQPKPQTTAGPQPPTETQPQPQTTAGPQPPTETQPKPQTTAGPQPPTETQPKPQTTAGPQPPTETQPKPQTAGPQPPTETQPKPQTTAGPQPPTETQPQPQTTAGPQPPTQTRPKPQTTAGPQPPTQTQPKPQTTAGPQPPTQTQPKPQTTVGPQPPTQTQPKPQTTAGPQPPTQTQPKPQTTVGPQPPTQTQPKPQTTAGPQPQTETQPKPQTTVGPQPPTQTQPKPQTTAGPQPPTQTQPKPQTTVGPQPPTQTQPKPQTTVGPQPPTQTQPQPQTTAGPQPPTQTQPKPQTTAGPQPPTTVKPQLTTITPQHTSTLGPQTTTTPVPIYCLAPSCPENSHYTTCIPACSPTCVHLNGPPRCNDNEGCVPGCVCDDHFVQKGSFCVPIQWCGCVDKNGGKYHFNEEWYTDHCSNKCECELEDDLGKIDCDDKDECDGNAVCLQNEMGDYYCQSTGFSECTINGNPEYKTFDKMKHDFEGEHSYVLIRTKNLPNNLPDVYIEGIYTRTSDNDDDDQHHSDRSSEEDHDSRVREEDDDEDNEDDDDDSKEHNEHHRLQELKIRVYNHTVKFKKNLRLTVDGKGTNTPVSPTAGLNIRKRSFRIYLETDFGLSVKFNKRSKAEITLPHIYKRRMGGLCGNFDGLKWNDQMKPDGSRAPTVQEFGESWRV